MNELRTASRLLLGSLLLALAAAGCQLFPAEEDPSSERQIVVRTGTSFGECVGFCRTELIVDPNQAIFRIFVQDFRTGPPDIEVTRELPPDTWSRLLGTFSMAQFLDLDEVYGCPDCVDQGAEWIEIETETRVKRVTFDYGLELDEIRTLQRELRALRAWIQPEIEGDREDSGIRERPAPSISVAR